MVAFVVIHNFLVGLVCLMVARRIWQFRCNLAVIADRILAVERAVDHVLYPAPNAIRKAQAGANRLRNRYEQLGIQYARIQQIMSILSISQLFWRYRRLVIPKSPPIYTPTRRK